MYESWRNYCEKLRLDPGLLLAEEDNSVFNNVAESITDFINQNGISGEAVFVWERFEDNEFRGKNRLGILMHTPVGPLIRIIPRPLDERTEDGADFTTELTRVRDEQQKMSFSRCLPVGKVLAKVGHNTVVEESVEGEALNAASLAHLHGASVALATPECLVLKLAGGGEVTVVPENCSLAYAKKQ
ncbi:hypothetical protein SY88_05715 [Clostridiales bacterium PH28_bin88]|nr:hypothetical protein SY88_05715 [Clostridiales bacterium PH28_bin88]